MSKKDRYYKILKIDKGASKEDIEEAYKKELRKNHPEKNPEGFKIIRRAYEILTDQYSFYINDKDLKIKCNHCNQLYKIPKSIGKIKVICPHCQKSYIVNTDI